MAAKKSKRRKNVSLKIGKHKSRSGGLTAAGRRKYNRETGSNLKAPQPGGGPRKRSFCARMKGVKGPMRKNCLLYTSPSPRDGLLSRMPSSA